AAVAGAGATAAGSGGSRPGAAAVPGRRTWASAGVAPVGGRSGGGCAAVAAAAARVAVAAASAADVAGAGEASPKPEAGAQARASSPAGETESWSTPRVAPPPKAPHAT
ncbi:unnamed protein product, partial [Ectocarpus fasciculatus]